MASRPVRIAITANGAPARSEFGKTASSAETMGTKFANATKSASGMGKTFERVAKIGATMFVAERVGEYAGELVGAASKYQSAMNLLVTAGGEAQSAIKGVSSGILKISGQTGTSADDLAEGMYTIEKAGYRAAAGLNVLKASAEGARAENVDMATMTNAVTSIMTSYHGKASDAVSVTNELVAASGAAKTTMQNYAGSLASVLPSASAAGISFAEVGGAIATLTQHGTSADEATQELANTIRNLAAPNQVASKEMQQLGINVTDLSKNLGKRGLTGTLALVENAIGKSMGKSGLVILDAFRKSKSASQDLQLMLKSMPPDLEKLSKGFLDGSVPLGDYQKEVKGFGGSAAAMGTQFMSLVKSSQGFNQLLTSGSPAAQTFTDALKRMLGGATGMNTALQLGGENAAGFKSRVEEIGKAAKNSGKDISTWAQTQKTFDTQVGRLENSAKNVAIKALLPLLPKMADGFAKVSDELDKDHPALDEVGHIIGDLAKAVDSLPGPLKSAALQAALFYPIMSKLSTGMTGFGASVRANLGSNGLVGWSAAMRDAETRSTAAGLAVLKMGEVARTAAGPVGMIALTQAAGQSNKTLSTLETTAGAVALGFAVGGPVGAALAGAGGLAYTLAKNIGKSSGAIAANKALITTTAPSLADYKSNVDSLASTFDRLSGAVTKATRTEVANQIIKSGDMSVLSKYGLTLKQVTDATLGIGNAGNKVGAVSVQMNSQWEKDQLAINGMQQALRGANSAYGVLTGTQKDALKAKIANLEADQKNLSNAGKMITGLKTQSQAAHAEWVQQQLANKGYVGAKKALDALPKQIVTTVTSKGVTGTIADAKKLASTVKLTPKQATVLLKAEGLSTSKANIQALINAAKHASAESGPLGSGAGSSFGAGYTSGISKWTGPAKYAAAALAAAAHGAAMRAQDSHSPSRKAAKLGRWFSEGYANGIADPVMQRKATDGGVALARAATKGADKESKKHKPAASFTGNILTALIGGISGTSSIDGAMSRITTLVDHAITGKHQTKRQDAIIKSLLPAENKVKAIAKQYDAIASGTNAAGDGPSSAAGFSAKLKAQMLAVSKITGDQINNLNDARQALKDYQKAATDYAGSIKDAIVATGDITTLGINQQTGGVSLPVLLSDMQSKVTAAEKFKTDMVKLTKAGLNQTDLQQLYAAGPDSLATADAILSGGATAIKQINGLASQLTATGTALGATASKTFYQSGINAAQGLVDGLAAKQDQVKAIGKKMAAALVSEIKKELKIKSPSRVFKQIGSYSVEGLDAGFNTTAIKRIGTTSATTLVKSFGRPSLAAYMSSSSTASAASVKPQAVHLSADQLNDLVMGRKVQAWIDAANGVGIRKAASGA